MNTVHEKKQLTPILCCRLDSVAPPLPKAEASDINVLLWLDNKIQVQNPVPGIKWMFFSVGN